MAVATVQLNFRITVETAAKLEELAKVYGTKTAVVEQAINRLYEEKKGDK